MGIAAALRLSAMAHYGDPAVREASRHVQIQALEVALCLQHLAAGWLIYAYNGPADHRDSFIDESLWPITSGTFGDEHRSVAQLLSELRASSARNADDAASSRRNAARNSPRLALVTICDYPEASQLPRWAAFVHGIYAQKHHG